MSEAFARFCYNKFCIEIRNRQKSRKTNRNFAITNFVLKSIYTTTMPICRVYFAITNFVLKYDRNVDYARF